MLKILDILKMLLLLKIIKTIIKVRKSIKQQKRCEKNMPEEKTLETKKMMAWTDLFHFHYNGSFDLCWIQKLAGTTTKLIIKVSALSMKISYQCPWKIGAWTTFSRGENESLSFRDQVLSRSLASIFFWWLFDKLDTHEQYFGWNYEINHH